jgi:hypothetical protein
VNLAIPEEVEYLWDSTGRTYGYVQDRTEKKWREVNKSTTRYLHGTPLEKRPWAQKTCTKTSDLKGGGRQLTMRVPEQKGMRILDNGNAGFRLPDEDEPIPLCASRTRQQTVDWNPGVGTRTRWWPGLEDTERGTREREREKKDVKSENKVSIASWRKRPVELWTYNCFYLTDERLRRFSDRIHDKNTCSFMGLQGTKRTYKGDELPVTLKTLENHDVWEARTKWKKASGNGSLAGVALLAPRGFRNIVRAVWTPLQNDKNLEGRVLIVWFSHAGMDLVVVVAYAPCNSNKVQDQNETQRMWNWITMNLENGRNSC